MPSFGGIATHTVFDIQLTVFTEPVSLAIAAEAKGLFGVQDQLSVVLQLNQSQTDAIWAFGVAIGTDFHLANIDDKFAGLKSLNSMTSGGIIVASRNVPFTFPNSEPIDAIPGVTIFGDFPLKGHIGGAISHWTGITELKLVGQYYFHTEHLHLAAEIDTNWHIGKRVSVNSAELFIDLPGTLGQGAFDIGIGATFGVQVGKTGSTNGHIVCDGSIIVSEVGFTLQAGLDTPWVKPFGLKGVEIYDTEVEIGLSFADFVPFVFGVSGEQLVIHLSNCTLSGDTHTCTFVPLC